ncbi:peptidoglycan-associated lipoprotein Pal [Legionella israelensis]|uniref:Peptidoglycan-associated lipoprotein n=1 Tax=Legionella israelensis TaxID=454 RepID=A0A0W0WNH3_9GAMM|nr:peptidoglycan-associated lipoprotein Pal [Legionella israelensis]KTD33859.1 peptidoglycan-associated lipoprotein precursor (19 kDa surface antigen) (PPL) [Legionella israelensis]QBR83586.1 peptidoglycan-associated lipoprotein Pal [Legionella israelensis]QBS08973.1 peptidoglycan-associated lipoprotein Pal [Legionella israelensis]SCX81329.1 peptidoglycan-associated lipoprotein [Legionella israelensis DSM 19235]STX58666.1 Peptidoglycan-associated lipoprotein precursor [Legionella israelensis]
MKAGLFFKWGMAAASVLLLVSCSKAPSSTDAAELSDAEITAQGLGKLNRFGGQVQGESYTTQAPHNQVYLFAYDDSTLDRKYMPSLNAQSEYLKSHPGARVLLAGHTDERGSREYNVALGERRANAVAQLMRMSGVNRNQIRIVSYGKERPVSFGHDQASHRQNRRVEFIYEATR